MLEAQEAADVVAAYLTACLPNELPAGVEPPYITAYDEEVRQRPKGAVVVLWTGIDYQYADGRPPAPPPARTIGVRVAITAACPAPSDTADLISTLLSAAERAFIRDPFLGVEQDRRSAFEARIVSTDYAESQDEKRRQQAAVIELDVSESPDTLLR